MAAALFITFLLPEAPFSPAHQNRCGTINPFYLTTCFFLNAAPESFKQANSSN
jgi:hypothetical protein